MTEIYGTLGPKCSDRETLAQMLRAGMTGIRLNLSHIKLTQAADQLAKLREAAEQTGTAPKLLIDLQGPELRVGTLSAPVMLENGEIVEICAKDAVSSNNEIKHNHVIKQIPVPEIILPSLSAGRQMLIDDGKLLLEVCAEPGAESVADPAADHAANVTARVLRGGLLQSRKSIALIGAEVYPPTLTDEDLDNISHAAEFGVYGIMQPFVRNRRDIVNLRNALRDAGAEHIRIFAKIENQDGVRNLNDFIEEADEIIIARGDLGNAMPLWELPKVQKQISAECRKHGMPFMVVTQMLASMEHSAVPTRAEVSDIYNAILDGASSVMVTGETAAGDYPVEVIRYLANTVREAECG